MKTAGMKNRPNGFTVEITDATDPGLAMLIAEADAGGCFPFGPVSTIAEGREVAGRDLQIPDAPG